MSKRVKRTNRHHRRSRSRTGGVPMDDWIEGIPNVILVDYKKHNSFHHLFQDTHPVSIARELNERWIDPAYVMLAVSKEDSRKILKHLSQLT
jgi:hypothetical protein